VYCIAIAVATSVRFVVRLPWKLLVLTVPMVVIHLCQHIDSIRVEGQVGAIDNPQSIKLMTQSPLPKHKLRSVGSV
jgi:hypothetical protein